MTTDVEICNLALSRVRASRIGSLTDNQSAEAIQCNIIYPLARDHLLSSHAWGFAKETRALSLTGNTPDEWLYEYDYPNDCLDIHYVLPPEAGINIVTNAGVSTPRIDYEPIPYEVGTGENGSRVILTDYEEAYISYTKMVTDTRLFDAVFVQALAWLMAIDLAIPLGGDSGEKYQARAERKYMELMGNAKAKSANEREDGRQRLPRAIQARHGVGNRHYIYNDLLIRRY